MSETLSYQELKSEYDKVRKSLQIAENQARDLKQLFNLSSDMLCVADINGFLKKINPAFTKILGYKEEELLSKPYLDFVHPEDKEKTERVIKEKLEVGDTVLHFENRFLCKDGTYKILEWTSNPMVSEGVTYAVAREITERKRTEKKLIESEEKFRGLFDNMTVGFAYHKIILNNDGIPVDYEFLDINQMFTELTGLSREKTIGKRVTEILPGIENEPAIWIEKYGKVALDGLKISFESYSEFLNKWFLVNAYSHKKGYFVTVFINISDRKKFEENLIESEMKFRIISEQSLLGIFILQDNTVKYANNALTNIIDYSLEEIWNWT